MDKPLFKANPLDRPDTCGKTESVAEGSISSQLSRQLQKSKEKGTGERVGAFR
jgi:hypothetical protein